jgi:hypothetical protein
MATTTGTILSYDSFKREMLNKNVKATTTPDTFIVGLSTLSYTPDQNTHEALADITNEVVDAGYARQTLTSVALTEPSNGTWRFDCDNPVFSPSATMTARWWWMFNDTATSPLDMLCFYGLLDDGVADVVTPAGETLTFEVNASGIFELAG